MLTLLSPAKKLNLEPVDLPLAPTRPDFEQETRALISILKKLDVKGVQKLMKLSDALAKLNHERFCAFRPDGRSNTAKPAAFAFNGNVYEGLNILSFSNADLDFAQNHLRILSGLYGVLRPLDLIQPYRLEMGTRLKTEKGDNLYQFWGDKIAKKLLEDMAGHPDKALINLASNEYFKAVDKKLLSAAKIQVIEAKFLNIKDGNARNLMYYAKKARGEMARWIMTHGIDKADDLRGFDIAGYNYDKAMSKDGVLVFSRPQPEPASKNKAA